MTRLIKKYPNRRLYDTAESRYITLADIRDLVINGVDFSVIDKKSGDVITRSILLQVISEQEQTRDPIKNEADNGESNRRGTLAMARTSDINSATAQFFINLSDNDFLNHSTRDFGYAVFGEVVDGMDVVDAIAAVRTGDFGGQQDVPLENVKIIEVSIDE